ncbi:succinate dehydrogenase [Roseovarius sp. D22-M7]|uniref:succinate dehydrogenase n=1 Tax=Roseovarius sp. D22-M7 TaxID=3127116 RepID=UPI00301055A2
MRVAAACGALASLGACDVAGQAADAVARDRAKVVVNSVVASRFPGINAAPVTDCIIDAASSGEIIRIAGATVTGITPEISQEVVVIARRPESVQCIARNSLVLLGS